MKISNTNQLIFHAILSIVLWKFSFLSTYYGVLIIIVGTYYILEKRDPHNLFPIFFSAYIMGSEVFLRMTKASLFWEFGKYAVIFFFILGFIRKTQVLNFYLPILCYFILLLPSISMLPLDSINVWRQSISFNLSGPLCLAISSLYFYNSSITAKDLKKIIFYSILPIFSMSILIILKMPEIETYRFTPYSDPLTSGGFGPNQVSTILGYGIACLIFGQITRQYIFNSKIIDFCMLFLFTGLGLITFSRGGILAAIIACAVAISFYLFYGQKTIQILSKGLILLIAANIIWYGIVTITDGVISERYGFSEMSTEGKYILNLTGRAEIYAIDYNIFTDYFLTGSGPGQANELRESYGYKSQVAAHTEYSRMLAEHGILGFLSLIILLALPAIQIIERNNKINKFAKILFSLLVLLTLFHSAMRLAMSGFIYGLIFFKTHGMIGIYDNKHSV